MDEYGEGFEGEKGRKLFVLRNAGRFLVLNNKNLEFDGKSLLLYQR